MSEQEFESKDVEVAEESAEIAEESAEVSEDAEVSEESPEEDKLPLSSEQKEMIKILKLKVNGKEMEEELPFEIDPEHVEYLQKKFQMAAAGQEGMRTASQKSKELDELIRKAKENPYKFQEEIGLDPDELAELRIQQRIEEMQKSPEQLKQEALEIELAELRAKLKAEEDAKKEAEYSKLQKEIEVEMTSEIEKAISSNTKLPNSPYIVKRMADAMLWALDEGYADVKPSDIVPMVEKEIIKEYQQMVEMMPDQVLEAFMGKKATERLRQQRLSKINKAPESKIEDVVKKQPEVKPKKKFSYTDFLNKPLSELK